MKSIAIAILALTHMVTSFTPIIPFHITAAGTSKGNLNAIKSISIDDDSSKIDRRSFVENLVKATSIGATTILNPNNLYAETNTGFQMYQDEDCGFEVSIPQSWNKNEQELSDLDRRKLLLFIDPESSTNSMDSKTLLFIAYSSVRDDYTSLGSFGSVDQVAQATVLPKGKVANGQDTGVESELLSAVAANNAYYFDYIIKPENLEKIHFRSIFYLSQSSTGGAGSYLVTVTVQTPETEYAKRKDTFDQIISSFGKIKKA